MHVKYDQQFALSRISTHVCCSSPDPRATEDGENYFKTATLFSELPHWKITLSSSLITHYKLAVKCETFTQVTRIHYINKYNHIVNMTKTVSLQACQMKKT